MELDNKTNGNESDETGLKKSSDSDNTTTEAIDATGLSKRAKKKLLKRQQWLDTKQERRAKEKEKRKILALKRASDFPESRTSSRKSLKHNKMSDSSCKVKVVFDMQFADLMTQRDLGKCLKQITKCYSYNRRLTNQLQLYMTSMVGVVETEMSKNDGFRNWDFHFDIRRYYEVFNKESIVYLSSDADDVITELEDDKAYIIGGLVDHNHHKGLCHTKATQLGIPTARLPIDQFVQMRTRKVLTVNHVYEILAAVSQGKDWKEAFLGVIPERKGVMALKDVDKERSTEITEKATGNGDKSTKRSEKSINHVDNKLTEDSDKASEHKVESFENGDNNTEHAKNVDKPTEHSGDQFRELDDKLIEDSDEDVVDK